MNCGGAGRVDLVGGGPGPLDLLTLRAHRLLWEADVVVADRACPLEELRSALGADVIVVAVDGGRGSSRSDQDLVIRHASAGRRVVRLTAGDPFVLGGGAEELLSWRAAGLEVSVTPGISAAIAVPQAAGIPVTHRGVATGFRVIDGTRDVDCDLLADVGRSTTVVVLADAGSIPRIVSAARDAAAHAETPLAIVDQGTGGRSVRGSLRAADAGCRGAESFERAVVVIGDVAGESLTAPVHALAASRT